MQTRGFNLFSSESVTEGHPDKVADLISDSILDAYLAVDPQSKVACETLVTTGLVLVAGEIHCRSGHTVDVQTIVRKAIDDIGYTDGDLGFSANSCSVLNALHEQSQDIRQGVELQSGEVGAGDQGMMFGYATGETPEFMPLPIALAHRLTRRLAELRKSKALPWLRPDGKSQVTVAYEGTNQNQAAKFLHTLVLSTQHADSISQGELHHKIVNDVLRPAMPAELWSEDTRVFVNPTGRFVIGGPHGDTGLTGRKIIVDTYGGAAPHGGGAFSGKDPSKVDRSAAYAARYIAKNLVAAGLVERVLVQLSYAIGVSEPVGIFVDDFGTAQVDPVSLRSCIPEIFPVTPARIIRDLKLRRPIYKKTASYGHFGRAEPDFTWENLDRVDDLRSRFGIRSV